MSILYRTKGWLTVAQLGRAWTAEIPGAEQDPQQFEQDLVHLPSSPDRENFLSMLGCLLATAARTPNYSSEAYPFRDFTSYIERLFDAYGPKRCYWGSDITNDFDNSTYKQRITHFTDELPFLSEVDKDWVMGRSNLERLRWT